MKNIIIGLVSLLGLGGTWFFLQSCSEVDPGPTMLVIAERNTGNLLVINTETAEPIDTIALVDYEGQPITEIRGLVYHALGQRLYMSRTTTGGGDIYSAYLVTRKGRVLNADEEDHIYGVADLLMGKENVIIASVYYREDSNVDYGPGLLFLKTDGVTADSVKFSNSNICCGLGICYGDTEEEILVGQGPLQIMSTDLEGNTTLKAALTPQGFPSTNANEYQIMNMARDGNGPIYALVFRSGNTYLAQVDLTSELLINIGQINLVSGVRYHGLAFISENDLD